MGGRRSLASIAADRESAVLRLSLGGSVAAARRRRGLTQAALGARCGLSQSAISRLERGVPPLTVDDLVAVARALGLGPLLSLVRDPLDRPADAGHLSIQELLVRLARSTDGASLVELALPRRGRARSVDVCVIRRATRELIVEEAWNRIGDVGEAMRSFDEKLRLAAEAVVAFTPRPVAVRGVWVVRATRANRSLVAAYPALFAAKFPGSSRAWVRALVTGDRAPAEPGLVWCDVAATRIVEWRAPASGAA